MRLIITSVKDLIYSSAITCCYPSFVIAIASFKSKVQCSAYVTATFPHKGRDCIKQTFIV